jgi:hypothetical protein
VQIWTIAGIILARVAVLVEQGNEDYEESPTTSKTGVFGDKRRASRDLINAQRNGTLLNSNWAKDKVELQKDGCFTVSKEPVHGKENDRWLRVDWGLHHPLGLPLIKSM